MNNWESIVAAIEYLLQFKANPLDYVEIMADAIIQQRGIKLPPEEVIDALAEMRQSNTDISTLLPQPHSDATLREFFKALEVKLAELMGRQ
jgi:hypothetical protein